jgi:uncharacterized protein
MITTPTLPRQSVSWIDRYAPPIYLVLITLGEILTTYAPPVAGMAIHAMLLLSLLAHAAYAEEPPLQALLLALCIAPLIRILSLALPLSRLPQISWYFLVSIPLFLACSLLVRNLGYSRRDLKLTLGNPGEQILVMLLGIVLGVVEYSILRPRPLISTLTWQELLIPSLIFLICTGFSEELIFRGVLQKAAGDAVGKWAIIYVAAIFAVLHIGYRSIIDVLFVFLVGLLFGWIVEHTNSLFGVTFAHGLTNILLFLVMPFVGLPQIALPTLVLPTLPQLTLPIIGVPAWLIEVGLIALWAFLLASAALATRLNNRRRRQRAAQVAQTSHRQQVQALLQNKANDPIALAQAIRQWLAPEYVLIVARDKNQSVIEYAIGASGRRLQGMEGLRASWSAFAHSLSAADQQSHETSFHPFSRHTGTYLISPLDGERWLLIRTSADNKQVAHTALAGLMV